MNQRYDYSIDNVLIADKNGELFQWVQDYLRGEGWNKDLADHLSKEKPTISRLVEFPLHKLKRIMGPEKGMNFVEDPGIWEKRVNSLINSIKAGKKFPPLIVTDFWKPLELSDGSHRHEAFLRIGYKKYWTLFFFTKNESLKLLNET